MAIDWIDLEKELPTQDEKILILLHVTAVSNSCFITEGSFNKAIGWKIPFFTNQRFFVKFWARLNIPESEI